MPRMREVMVSHTIDEWMQLTKGLSAWKVALILIDHFPGCDWRGTNKRDMGTDAWCTNQIIDRPGLVEKLRKEPRPDRNRIKRERTLKRKIESLLNRAEYVELEKGIGALPAMLEKVREEDPELIVEFEAYVKSKQATAQLRINAARREWDQWQTLINALGGRT